MGTVLKGIAIVLFILDFIAAIFLSLDLGFLMFLYVVIGGFLFCLFLYAICEIIDQLETSNTNTYELYHLLKNMQEEKNTPTPPPAKRSILNTDWICNSCGTRNDSENYFCRDCGEHK